MESAEAADAENDEDNDAEQDAFASTYEDMFGAQDRRAKAMFSANPDKAPTQGFNKSQMDIFTAVSK